MSEFRKQRRIPGWMNRMIEYLFRPRWVVNRLGEMGFRFCGINFWYYKWPSPMVLLTEDAGDDTPGKPEGYDWREASKREFGEVVTSRIRAHDVEQYYLW